MAWTAGVRAAVEGRQWQRTTMTTTYHSRKQKRAALEGQLVWASAEAAVAAAARTLLPAQPPQVVAATPTPLPPMSAAPVVPVAAPPTPAATAAAAEAAARAAAEAERCPQQRRRRPCRCSHWAVPREAWSASPWLQISNSSKASTESPRQQKPWAAYPPRTQDHRPERHLPTVVEAWHQLAASWGRGLQRPWASPAAPSKAASAAAARPGQPARPLPKLRRQARWPWAWQHSAEGTWQKSS
mmetsp:Transcript_60117/g.196332  ORF Transcript_60117/g.196332 Transcript_60117/m.196332 type:complete len:242 (+) Transcript_60117:289-1014(+)